jgi:hypothetical protein
MKITLYAVTNIPAGVALRLSPEQAASRQHMLEPFGKQKGVYVGTQQLQFKAGESVEVIGDLPKGILPVYDRLRAEAVKERSVKEPATDPENEGGD